MDYTVTYTADVTSIVTAVGGNADYTIGGALDKDVPDPDPSVYLYALGEGVSLLVIYESTAEPVRDIMVYVGLTSTMSSYPRYHATATLGFPSFYPGCQAKFFMNVLDGQASIPGEDFVDHFVVNGIVVDGALGTIDIGHPFVPDAWQGTLGPDNVEPCGVWNMYDHAFGDAGPFMTRGDTSLTFDTTDPQLYPPASTPEAIGHSFACISFINCDPLPEPGGAFDRNGNSLQDACDIYNGTSEDCNGNCIPDEYDIAEATSDDCQCPPNGVPDECDIGFGDVVLGEPAIYTVGNRPTGVNATAQTADGRTVTLDIDSDGDGDLVAVNWSGTPKTLTILWNDGSGDFDETPSTTVELTGTISPHRAAAGDFDGDGDYDLAVARGTSSSGQVAILLNNGLDLSPPYAWLGLTQAADVSVGTDPRSIVTADLLTIE